MMYYIEIIPFSSTSVVCLSRMPKTLHVGLDLSAQVSCGLQNWFSCNVTVQLISWALTTGGRGIEGGLGKRRNEFQHF